MVFIMAKCYQQQSPSVFKVVTVNLVVSIPDPMGHQSQGAKGITRPVICAHGRGSVLKQPEEIIVFAGSFVRQGQRGDRAEVCSAHPVAQRYFCSCCFFRCKISLAPKKLMLEKSSCVVNISEKMSKFGIELSSGIVNVLNWSTNSSTSIILTDTNSIDIFQNNQLWSRVRPMNQEPLSLFLQWYFIGFSPFPKETLNERGSSRLHFWGWKCHGKMAGRSSSWRQFSSSWCCSNIWLQDQDSTGWESPAVLLLLERSVINTGAGGVSGEQWSWCFVYKKILDGSF